MLISNKTFQHTGTVVSSALTTVTILSGTSGVHIVIDDFTFSGDTAVGTWQLFHRDASTATLIYPKIYLGVSAATHKSDFRYKLPAGSSLMITTTGHTNHSLDVQWHGEDVL